MYLVFAGFVGLLAAVSIHWLTWSARMRTLNMITIAGIISAFVLTGFFLLFMNSDIANMMRNFLIVLWLVALAIGSLQAFSMRAPWWKGVLAIFFEMALAFLIGAAVNLTMQKYIPWLEQNFPGIPVYPVIDWFLRVLVCALLILALSRPLLQRYRSLMVTK